MSIQNEQLDSKQHPPSLVDSGMLQFTLAVAVIGFFFTSSNSVIPKMFGSIIFLGSSLVTLVLFFVYITQWGVQYIPAIEKLYSIKRYYSILALIVFASYLLVSGAMFSATILSILVLDLPTIFSIIFSVICFTIPGIIIAFGMLFLSLKTND